jgi:hypothetical protein
MTSLTEGSVRLAQGAVPIDCLAGVRDELLLVYEVFEFRLGQPAVPGNFLGAGRIGIVTTTS